MGLESVEERVSEGDMSVEEEVENGEVYLGECDVSMEMEVGEAYSGEVDMSEGVKHLLENYEKRLCMIMCDEVGKSTTPMFSMTCYLRY